MAPVTLERAFGTDLKSGGNLSGPAALVRLSDNSLLVLDRYNMRVQQYGADGRYLGGWGRAPGGGPFPFTVPTDMTIDPGTGDVLISVTHRRATDVISSSCGGVFHADTLFAKCPSKFEAKTE